VCISKVPIHLGVHLIKISVNFIGRLIVFIGKSDVLIIFIHQIGRDKNTNKLKQTTIVQRMKRCKLHIALGEVLMALLRSRCLPMLLYGILRLVL